MVTLDPELQALRSTLLEMLALTRKQLEQCLSAIEHGDLKETKKVIKKEKRINSLDINIDQDCENILALHNPVASDLRFVIATLKMSSHLERIADNSKSLAKYIRQNIKKSNLQLLEQFHVKEMLLVALGMMDEMEGAIQKGDVTPVSSIMSKDKELDASRKRAFKIATKMLKENTGNAGQILKSYTIVRRVERIGDYIKNIGEELIFHLEAKVIKHGADK